MVELRVEREHVFVRGVGAWWCTCDPTRLFYLTSRGDGRKARVRWRAHIAERLAAGERIVVGRG